MTTSTLELLPGTEVTPVGSAGSGVTQSLGPQTLFRLRGLENAVWARNWTSSPRLSRFWRSSTNCGRIARPAGQLAGLPSGVPSGTSPGARCTVVVQPGRLRLEPYQLVPSCGDSHEPRSAASGRWGGAGQDDPSGPRDVELVARRVGASHPDRLPRWTAAGAMEGRDVPAVRPAAGSDRPRQTGRSPPQH